MYLRGLADDSTAFESNFPDTPQGSDLVSTPDFYDTLHNSGTISATPSLPNIAPATANAAQGGSPSWTSLIQSAISTYGSTRQAQAAQAIAQSRNTALPIAPVYRYPTTTARYSPFQAGASGSGPAGLSTGTLLLTLAGLGLGAVLLAGK